MLPDKDAVYDENSPIAADGFALDINAIGSKKEFKSIVFANSSFTESVTLETTPAVNVEIDVTDEKMGDGIFELEALIVCVTLRSALGPYTDDEGMAMKVALPASFHRTRSRKSDFHWNSVSQRNVQEYSS